MGIRFQTSTATFMIRVYFVCVYINWQRIGLISQEMKISIGIPFRSHCDRASMRKYMHKDILTK